MFLFNYKNRKQRILIHILFWIIYVLFFSVMALNPRITYLQSLLNGLSFVPVDIFATYVMIYLLIPIFLKPKKYLLFTLFTILLAFTTIFFNLCIKYFFYIPVFYPEWLDKRVFWLDNYWYTLVATYIVVIFGAGVKLTKMWVKEQKDRNDLENQKIKSELLMLKSQINPHFLFNTLNNIDALIETNPQKASESIIRLSDILRYVTYNTVDDFVTIQKEEDSLRSFIELNALRFGENFISYNVNMFNKNRLIAPMLLIPLVENAIKHGDKKVQFPAIKVELLVSSHIQFVVTNAVSADLLQKDSLGGVGIANLKRRLELLYPNAYHFEHALAGNQYTTNLWIQ